MWGPRPARSESTPIAQTPAAFAALSVPGPQPPATSNTVPAPRAISLRATAAHFAGSTKSRLYPVSTFTPGDARSAPAR